MLARHVYSVILADDTQDRHPWAQIIQAKEDVTWLDPMGTLTGHILLYFSAPTASSFAEYVVYLVAEGGRAPFTSGPEYLGLVTPAGSDPLHVWVAVADEHTRRDVASAS